MDVVYWGSFGSRPLLGLQSSLRLGLQPPQGSLGGGPLPISLAWSL